MGLRWRAPARDVMKLVLWPIRWMKTLPHLMVSGALVYAAAVQWAGESAMVELASHGRLYALAACLAGSLLFLIGLSLGRVVIGLAVAVWLAWPMVPYFFGAPDPVASSGEAKENGSSAAPPEIKIASFNLHYRNQTPDLMDAILAWDADVVVLAEVGNDFYQRHFQAARERYPDHWMSIDNREHGVWCFTRLPVARDLCRTRSKATGVAACDWTLRPAGGGEFRFIALHAPPPLSADLRAARLKALGQAAAALGGHEGPRVLAGDLNCSPFSPVFTRLLAEGRVRDSALGHGLDFTWSPFPGAGLTIDHVLVSDHWEVSDRSLGEFLGSDHRPVLVTLRLARIPGADGK